MGVQLEASKSVASKSLKPHLAAFLLLPPSCTVPTCAFICRHLLCKLQAVPIQASPSPPRLHSRPKERKLRFRAWFPTVSETNFGPLVLVQKMAGRDSAGKGRGWLGNLYVTEGGPGLVAFRFHSGTRVCFSYVHGVVSCAALAASQPLFVANAITIMF